MSVSTIPDKVYEACLVELYKTMRAASFYQIDHPALGQSVDRALRYFHNLLTIADRIEFTVTRHQILFHDKPLLGQQQVLRSLATELFRRRIKTLIFLRGIEATDIVGFLRMIKLDTEELVRKGGAEDVLARFGVKAIWSNEVNFSRLEEIQAEDEEEEEEEELFEEESEETLELQEEAPFGNPLTSEQEQLRRLLLNMLDSDGDDFMAVLKEVVQEGKILVADANYAEASVVLEGLMEYATGSMYGVSEREYAFKAIRALATKEVLQDRIRELEKRPHDRIQAIVRLFQTIGKVTVPYLIRALAEAEDRLARRNLTRAIIAFGPDALPAVVTGLNDPRWYLQRNLLVILSDIAGPEQLPDILPLLDAPDIRVAKEAVKAIGRLGGTAGLEALGAKLATARPELQIRIVLLFGTMRWYEGHQAMETLAQKGETEDVQVAACQALGKMAAEESFPVLVKIYKSKGFLKTDKRLPVRRAALKALVNYGRQAEPIFKQALAESDIELRGTARIALERLAETTSGEEGAS